MRFDRLWWMQVIVPLLGWLVSAFIVAQVGEYLSPGISDTQMRVATFLAVISLVRTLEIEWKCARALRAIDVILKTKADK